MSDKILEYLHRVEWNKLQDTCTAYREGKLKI